jgi:uncharacterized repeat protein (TIGR03833 family)
MRSAGLSGVAGRLNRRPPFPLAGGFRPGRGKRTTAVAKQGNRLGSEAGGLTHHPFANLVPGREPVAPAPPCGPPLAVRIRLETAGRSGKAVTRITGLPGDNLEVIASRLRKALGCGAVVEGQDLVLLGSLVERASTWLERAGDPRAILPEPRAPRTPRREEAPSAAALVATTPDHGTRRGEVRRGQRVAIVQKADQQSGKLTEGIVRDLLTKSETHPRGIKVRLESGEVGRVKIIYG